MDPHETDLATPMAPTDRKAELEALIAECVAETLREAGLDAGPVTSLVENAFAPDKPPREDVPPETAGRAGEG